MNILFPDFFIAYEIIKFSVPSEDEQKINRRARGGRRDFLGERQKYQMIPKK
jgi:hypothetical protein